MAKELLISVSPYVQKYYINETFKDLPDDIKETLRAKLAVIAEKTNAVISLGFSDETDIYVEYKYEDLSYVDEIGIELRMKKFQQDEVELLRSLKMWYMLYHTSNGEMMREVLLLQRSGKSKEEIAATLMKKHGEHFKEFIEEMLEQ